MARAIFLVSILSVVVRCEFNFVAIGDWGGENDQEPATESQRETAAAMMRKVKDDSADFVLMMGDNYYHHGVSCPADVSPRFKETFEEVYAALLPNATFYAVAGNHDYGEGRLSNISAQLAYSSTSPHWNFPSLWYSLRRNFMADGKERTLKLILIDTVVLCGNGAANVDFIDTQLEFLGQKADPARPGHVRKVLAERQWSWLERELEEARDTDYLWVSGHYPIFSAGSDGSQQCLIDRLLPLIQLHRAQYISGHDHNLEHVNIGDTNMFVAGSGKECCYDPVNLHQVPLRAMRFMVAGWHGQLSEPSLTKPVHGGFASFHFGADFATVILHSQTGEVLYTAPGILRRSTTPESTISKLVWRRASPESTISNHTTSEFVIGGICLVFFGISLCAAVLMLVRSCQRRSCCKEYTLLEAA